MRDYAITSQPDQDGAPDVTAQDNAMHLTFLINSMEGGGAERAMANLLRHLDGELPGLRVELVLLDDRPVAQDIPDWVETVVLDGRGSMLRSARVLLRHLRNSPPTVCISYLARANCLNVVTSLMTGHRAVISERVQTTSHLSTSRAGALYRLITRVTYPRASRIIAVSEGVADDLVENFGVPRDKTAVIGNPIDAGSLNRAASEPPAIALPDRYILAVGRMVVNKNFPMLIEGYAAANPQADLVILGEGPDRAELERLVVEKGLAGHVHMPGFVQNPYPVMAGAEYLVSCSNAEGFPNTIIEAMTLGNAIIATDCPSGPSEVLRGNAVEGRPVDQNARDGLLIRMGAAQELCEAMKLYENKDTRADYAQRALTRSKAFGSDAVVRNYLGIIGEGMRA